MRGLFGSIGLLAWSVATCAEVPLADFAASPAYGDVRISPDGENLAATMLQNGQVVLALFTVPGMNIKALRPREGDDVADFAWVAPDRLIYNEGQHVEGNDRPFSTGELFTVKADGTGVAMLFGYRAGEQGHTASHIQRATADAAAGFLIAPLRDDPNHALIATYAWNGPGHSANKLGVHPEAYKIDVRDGRKSLVTTSPLRGADFLADHSGAIRFAYGIDTDQVRRVWYRDTDGDWKLLHDEAKTHQRFTPLMFNRSNDAVYVVCDGANGIGGICRWNAKTHEQETLWSAKEAAATGLVTTFDGLDAFAIRSMPGRTAVTLLDKNAPEASALISMMQQFPGEDVEITSASRDGKRVIAFVHSDTDPGVFYLYEADKKKARALFERRPSIKPAQMAAVEPVSLKARDGTDLHGYLTRPLGKETAKQLPTVVLVHGGPYGERDKWEFDSEVQMLASRGYAVMQVNFRGSGGYGDAFETAGFKEWGGKMQDDVTDATRWVIEQGVADAKRICVYGTSYGGYAALEGAVKEPDLYKCAIGNAGIYDLRLMHSRGDVPQSVFGENYLKLVLGTDSSDLWERSPMAHLDSLKAAVMLIAGGADARVPSVQAENLHNRLTERKVAHEWLYEGREGHGFYTAAHVAAMYDKILAFLDHNIGSSAKVAVNP
jgi:dipeptidyl aminopeptidase/acylaminoacyl peptidase